MKSHTFEEDNAAFADKVEGLASDLKRDGTEKALQSEMQTERAGEHLPYWVRVIDPSGRVLAERAGMARRIPVEKFPAPPANGSLGLQPIDYRIGGELFSLVSIEVHTSGGVHRVQVAQDRTADENFNRQAGLLFLAMLATSVVASAVIALTTTKKALWPLEQMSQAFQRVGPTRLTEQVSSVGWPRELSPLAESFDQMLRRLDESFTKLSQFSADLAHELRTPISNMLGEAQVTLTRDRTADEYRQVIESTVAECERLSRIVDNLLFLARAESAREQIKSTRFDGRAAIEKIAGFYQTVAEERNITLTCEGNGDVDADSFLFTRAVSNLVDNAMRFTASGGRIRIAISKSTDGAEISVVDNGCGISASHIPRVFDRFYTVDPSRNAGGAGLGLSLVKSIAELHGGAVHIESAADRGTTVRLKLPNKSAPANGVRRQEPAIPC